MVYIFPTDHVHVLHTVCMHLRVKHSLRRSGKNNSITHSIFHRFVWLHLHPISGIGCILRTIIIDTTLTTEPRSSETNMRLGEMIQRLYVLFCPIFHSSVGRDRYVSPRKGKRCPHTGSFRESRCSEINLTLHSGCGSGFHHNIIRYG